MNHRLSSTPSTLNTNTAKCRTAMTMTLDPSLHLPSLASTFPSSAYSTPLPAHSSSLLPPPVNAPSYLSTPSSTALCSNPSWQQCGSFQTPTSASCNKQPSSASSSIAHCPVDLASIAKVGMVESLVDTAALIIESIWPSVLGSVQYSQKSPVIPLNIFVKETLRRSKTTLSTLQLALYYVYRVRSQVLIAQEKFRQDQRSHFQQSMSALQQHGYPPSPNHSTDGMSEDEMKLNKDYFYANQPQRPITPPAQGTHTPASLSPLSLGTAASASTPILQVSEPVSCGRRMFLAALILASKYQQDRTFSNRAWSRICGLPVQEINQNEIAFLKLIDHRLFVSHVVFQKWVSILAEKGLLRDRVSAAAMSASTTLAESLPSPPSLLYGNCNVAAPRRSSVTSTTLPPRMTCITPATLGAYAKTTLPKLIAPCPLAYPTQESNATTVDLNVNNSFNTNHLNILNNLHSNTFNKTHSIQNSSNLASHTLNALADTSVNFAKSIVGNSTSRKNYSVLAYQEAQQQCAAFYNILQQPLTSTTTGQTSMGSRPLINISEPVSSGLVQPLSAQRQQQGMGPTMTQRWVQAQRREFLKSLSAGGPAATALTGAEITGSSNTNASMQTSAKAIPAHIQRFDSIGSCLPSPVSSMSPVGPMAGSKRHASDVEDFVAPNERATKSQRRLSVSFLTE